MNVTFSTRRHYYSESKNTRMLRQWIDKLLEDLQRAVDRITTMDEILLGVILAFVLLIILTLLGFFD